MSNEIMDLEDQRLINLTLKTREKIITELTAKGIPEDNSDRSFLTNTLDGLDRTVLAKTKIKVDDKSNQNQQEAAKIIAEVLKRTNIRTITSDEVIVPLLDKDIIVDNPVPGETDIGAAEITYDEIMKPI